MVVRGGGAVGGYGVVQSKIGGWPVEEQLLARRLVIMIAYSAELIRARRCIPYDSTGVVFTKDD